MSPEQTAPDWGRVPIETWPVEVLRQRYLALEALAREVAGVANDPAHYDDPRAPAVWLRTLGERAATVLGYLEPQAEEPTP